MSHPVCTLPIPKTQEDLEQAIQRYRSSDLQGDDLFCLWDAIRTASLQQTTPESRQDQLVPGDDSY
jgi:hypothetical protein